MKDTIRNVSKRLGRRGLTARERPTNERVYQVCAEVLCTAARLTLDATLPAAAEFRQRTIASLDRMVSDGRRLGIADADLAEARYALVAFIDEQIVHSDWAGRIGWMSRPLQLELYGENTAGENFFVRLRALLRAGGRSAAVEVYYLCLLLGFRGAHRDGAQPGALAQLTRAARDQLEQALPDPSIVSPNGQIESSIRAVPTSWALLLVTALGGLLLITLVLGGLSWSIHARLEAAESRMKPNEAKPTPLTAEP
jgi:type VI secretion system protein ImpK